MGRLEYDYSSSQHSHTHNDLYASVGPLIANTPPGSIVLDLGCGNGSFLSMFQDKGWKLYGTDFSNSGIAIAQQHYPGIEFFVGDAQTSVSQIQQRCGPVDLIISTEVIEHLYDPRSFLETAFKVLKPGGRMVLSTPYHGYLKNVMLAVTNKMDTHFTATWDHGHIKFWSKKTLQIVLEEAGFKIEKFTGFGRIPYLWRSMVLLISKPE